VHAASIAAHVITIALRLPRASTFWRKQPTRDARWWVSPARVAVRASCTSTPAVVDARSGRVPMRRASNTAACATSFPAIGYRFFRTMAGFTTATYWCSLRNWQRMARTSGWPTRRSAGRASAGPGLAGMNWFATAVGHLSVPTGLVQHRRHVARASSTQIRQPWTLNKVARWSRRRGEYE
jgi:hypothetical protein